MRHILFNDHYFLFNENSKFIFYKTQSHWLSFLFNMLSMSARYRTKPFQKVNIRLYLVYLAQKCNFVWDKNSKIVNLFKKFELRT